LVRWTRRASTRDFCSVLAALVSPVYNIIFLILHFSTLLVPITQQPGQAGVLGRLSLIMTVVYRSVSFLFHGLKCPVSAQCTVPIAQHIRIDAPPPPSPSDRGHSALTPDPPEEVESQDPPPWGD
jgi:hypothetical protein